MAEGSRKGLRIYMAQASDAYFKPYVYHVWWPRSSGRARWLSSHSIALMAVGRSGLVSARVVVEHGVMLKMVM